MKVMFFKVIVNAPNTWTDEQAESWLETKGADIRRQLRQLAYRESDPDRHIEITVEE